MAHASLTVRDITARPVVLRLKRPVVARIATITEWPLILIDLLTEEGIVGRSYLEPYVVKSMRYLVPALNDLGAMLKGRHVAPIELFDAARKSLHFVGYEGLSMIAASGLDMAAWDAVAKGANLPLCVLLGGSVGPVKSYNSNGLWLKEPEAVAEEALELRGEGDSPGSSCDWVASEYLTILRPLMRCARPWVRRCTSWSISTSASILPKRYGDAT
jgi:mandelate racemase